jgi:hypothetical protein
MPDKSEIEFFIIPSSRFIVGRESLPKSNEEGKRKNIQHKPEFILLP